MLEWWVVPEKIKYAKLELLIAIAAVAKALDNVPADNEPASLLSEALKKILVDHYSRIFPSLDRDSMSFDDFYRVNFFHELSDKQRDALAEHLDESTAEVVFDEVQNFLNANSEQLFKLVAQVEQAEKVFRSFTNAMMASAKSAPKLHTCLNNILKIADASASSVSPSLYLTQFIEAHTRDRANSVLSFFISKPTHWIKNPKSLTEIIEYIIKNPDSRSAKITCELGWTRRHDDGTLCINKDAPEAVKKELEKYFLTEDLSPEPIKSRPTSAYSRR